MEHWLGSIIDSIKELDTPSIIAICGAADLGKSYISKDIVDTLLDLDINAVHLTLDSYLIEREERKKLGISGYELDAYDKMGALNALSQFKKHRPIEFFPYCHEKGRKAENSIILNPASVLVFDGVQSMHKNFRPYIDLSVFIYTENCTLKKIRFEADLNKRKHSVDFANSNSEFEFLKYKSNIEPYKTQANYQLFMGRKWQYEIHTQQVA